MKIIQNKTELIFQLKIVHVKMAIIKMKMLAPAIPVSILA